MIEKMIKFLEDLNSSDIPTRINKLINFLDVPDVTGKEENEKFGFTAAQLGMNKELIDSLCPSINDILPILMRVNESTIDGTLKASVEFADVEKITIEEYLKTL